MKFAIFFVLSLLSLAIGLIKISFQRQLKIRVSGLPKPLLGRNRIISRSCAACEDEEHEEISPKSVYTTLPYPSISLSSVDIRVGLVVCTENKELVDNFQKVWLVIIFIFVCFETIAFPIFPPMENLSYIS
jgi:hypothetical protein